MREGGEEENGGCGWRGEEKTKIGVEEWKKSVSTIREKEGKRLGERGREEK